VVAEPSARSRAQRVDIATRSGSARPSAGETPDSPSPDSHSHAESDRTAQMSDAGDDGAEPGELSWRA
jgi:hypothetical protein